MTAPIPSDARIVATGGTEPQNLFVKLVEDAAGQLRTQLSQPDFQRAVISGLFSFLGKEFPVAAAFLGPTEGFILTLIAAVPK